MRPAKRKALQKAGFRIGSVQEFFELSAEDALYIEIKLELARELRALRRERSLTQVQLAERVASSQSRVAKMEAADATVSIDLIVRSLIALGATSGDVADAVRRAAR